MDLERIFLPEKYKFIDFPDFTKEFQQAFQAQNSSMSQLIADHFYFHSPRKLEEIDQANSSKTFMERFQEVMQGHKIALIYSAFHLGRYNIGNTHESKSLLTFHPVGEIRKVIQYLIRKSIGSRFWGIDIRILDKFMRTPKRIPEHCRIPTFTKHYSMLFDKLLAANITFDRRNVTIYIGKSHDRTKDCFDKLIKDHSLYASNLTMKTTTIDHLIADDPILEAMVESIPQERSSILLVIDQILLGLSDQLITANMMGGVSSYQNILKLRRTKRDEIQSEIILQTRRQEPSPTTQISNILK